jgi:hypothetical protein
MAFAIIQSTKDVYILEAIKLFLGVGSVYSHTNGISNFRLENVQLIKHVLLPFLFFHPLRGHKLLQYELWLKAILIKLAFYKKRDEATLDFTSSKLKLIIDELSELSPNKRKEKKKLANLKIVNNDLNKEENTNT